MVTQEVAMIFLLALVIVTDMVVSPLLASLIFASVMRSASDALLAASVTFSILFPPPTSTFIVWFLSLLVYSYFAPV